ncbi:Peptidase S28 family-containing protein [Aphelenchoides bicaudatus]|nr:Peptidase S28 family-containing protein [Aphelenchoides bicaudatus]
MLTTRLTAWIGLAVILCLMFQETKARVFLANGQTQRDYMMDMILEKHYGIPRGAADDETVCKDDKTKKITVAWFTQHLDHFNSSDTRTWGQHYQVNEKFFDSTADSEVIFLLIGGEGAMSSNWVCFENYTYMKLAADKKALVIQLEHRFFGSNTGLGELSSDNLKYLNTKQALADLNEFVKGYNVQRKFKAPRWVFFGGSYPGTMAALFKREYPNSIQGAISSSSVFGPKVDLYEYALKMEQVLIETDNELQTNMLSETGRDNVRRDLGIDKSIKISNIDDILTVQFRIFDAFQGMFQYSYDGRSDSNHVGHPLTVTNLCQIMTKVDKKKQSATRLAEVYQVANSANAPIDPSYQNLIKPWQLQNNTDKDTRGWLWLQCGQFGYLQSTSNLGVFGNAVPVTFLTKMCTDLFQIDITTLYANVRDALAYFKQPWEFNAVGNVAFPIGGYDPWSMLATNISDISRRLVSHVTPGTAHCSDMYPSYPNEPAGLKEVRQFVIDEVTFYLSQPSVWTNNGNTGATQAPGTGATKASTQPPTTSFVPSQTICHALLFAFSFALTYLLKN